jgi:molybdenum cofactor synthesis domain-containing protein
MDVKVGILTVSDRAASGEYSDKSGPLIADILSRRMGWTLFEQAIVGDELEDISGRLESWINQGLHLILTTGGTGFSQRDVTPEATLQVITRQAPGIVEALRQESLKITQHAMLSRAVAGIRDRTLIINLPGSPKAIKENLDVLVPILPHAMALILGEAEAESGHRTV